MLGRLLAANRVFVLATGVDAALLLSFYYAGWYRAFVTNICVLYIVSGNDPPRNVDH